MKSFTALGDHQFINCQIDSGELPMGGMTKRINVEAGTPLILATLFNPETGASPLSTNVQMVITGPDGTEYNQATNTSTALVSVVNGNTYVVCITNPSEGLWTIKCTCTNTSLYRANLIVFPTVDQISTTMSTMLHYMEKSDFLRGAQLTYELYKWVYWPVNVLIKVAQSTSALKLNLESLLTTIFGSPSSYNQDIIAKTANQSVEGVNITVAQILNLVTEDVYDEVLLNGAANDNLEDWTIISNGGAGWSVQQHYASPIQYTNNFAVSNGWCKKSQLIDLVNDVGLATDFLDQSPGITIKDFIAVMYPSTTSSKAQYYLNIELRDKNHNVIKRVNSGNIPLTEATGQSATSLDWEGVSFFFENYGPNVRYIYFEHGGINPEVYSSNDYGLKMTGASVKVQLMRPEPPNKNVLENGSAQNGTTGWTIPAGSASWSIDNGAAIACPGSPGTKDFTSTQGTATKYQEIDLIAKGYTGDFLDTAPFINISDWMCVSMGCECSYQWQIELLDANKAVLKSFDSGVVKMPATVLSVAPFVRYQKVFTNYGSGVRYIKFQHSATPENTGMAAKLTGASIEFPPMPPNSSLKRSAEVAMTTPSPIQNTNVEPLKWVSYLTTGKTAGTGWLTPQATPGIRLVGTAAHVIKSGDQSWAKMTIIPAAGNNKQPYSSPYDTIKVPINHCQVPYEWLVDAQTQVGGSTSHDYAAIYVDQASNWDVGGFTPTENQSNSFNAEISGFPAKTNANFFPTKLIHGDMYSESVKIKKYNNSEDSTNGELGEGSSGGAFYIKNGNSYEAVAIQSYYTGWSAYAMRINNEALSRFNNWKTRLSPNDAITKLQMVIRTGDIFGAGTDANIHATIDGKTYKLEKLWAGGSAFYRSRNERGDYDGYNLTPRLNELFPNGAKVSDLVGKEYSIDIEFSTIGVNLDVFGLSNESWFVESAAIYVNDQLLCAHNFNNWMQPQGSSSFFATINL